ncbi:hypothetical protein A7X95_04655 [Candidatus Nitrosopelagicus brevis]|uniref:Uncharacterized protein n=1 Tax=Candidatus Nitrosopelagicus brevis TaxID=1410606 RepID=A0A0A7V3C5_9ARCH|nr:hypothetical protein [Candidatus Nitrosopelagicus brevis]AJA92666.1 hypothetical protein T478_1408 [Candidatus Nitrosopelagicus brevis]PTL87209.1 hypothetical protein A7X95_04655 [Candidatus Nitrosopelagicus brevis]
MADDGGEQDVRNILDHSEFTFENRLYKIITNAKPYPETKTDFYILARDLDDETEREFKISYKKPSYSFIENKIQPHRIRMIYGEDWSEILKSQISQTNTEQENIHWMKKRPNEHLVDSFNNFPVIDFNKKKIVLGWRYEIEQLDAPKTGTRLHSGMIEQDISSQVFWGEGCSDEMRDAIVNGDIIPDSGIPDFILIRDPEEIQNANDVFNHIEDIREHAREHNEMRAGFITQNNRWNENGNRWKTEGLSRAFAVWIKWNVIDGNLRGRPVFNHPLERTSGDVIQNLKDCLEEMDITYESNFAFELLRDCLTEDTVSIG